MPSTSNPFNWVSYEEHLERRRRLELEARSQELERACQLERASSQMLQDIAPASLEESHMLYYNSRDIRDAVIPQPMPDPPYPSITSAIGNFQQQLADNIYYNNELISNNISDDIFGEDTGTVTSSHPQHKWPIGTIVKWDLNKDGVGNYLLSNSRDLDHPLIKIGNYSVNNINNVTWYGDCEPTNESFSIEFFTDATPIEVEQYNQAFNELRQLTTLPNIGVVVKYIGNDSSRRGKRAVVKCYARNNEILVMWLNASSAGTVGRYNFNKFQISKRQEGSFVMDMDNYCNCDHCGTLREILFTATICYKKYCDHDCALEAGNDYCRSCGVWNHKDNIQNTTASGNVCTSCYEAHYRECRTCNEYVMRTSMRANTTGQFECEYCRRYGVQLIHSYDYKPSPLYNKMPWENTRYLGIELEIECADGEEYRKPLAEKINVWLKQQSTVSTTLSGKKLDKLVYIKNDGSLEDGLELVFHPFTLKSFHKHFPLKAFIEFINENNAEVTSRCGMHVHVSKDKLSKLQLLKGKWFFYKCEPFLKKFSEREEFKYCQFEPHPPNNDVYDQEFGRRTAFNVAASPKTLELRLFKSTLDYTKFIANIQFADAFVDYIQHGAGIAFLKTHSKYQVWIDFIDYCKKDGKWQVMTNWILRKGIV